MNKDRNFQSKIPVNSRSKKRKRSKTRENEPQPSSSSSGSAPVPEKSFDQNPEFKNYLKE